MRITALAGGVGGARFIRGLRAHLDRSPALADSQVTVIGNTGDDISLFGLRVCPDLDTLMYTLGGGVHEDRAGGARTRRIAVQGELAAYGAVPQWFALGDRDFGTHIVRTQWLGQGRSLSEVTARLAARWGLPGQRRHPAADERLPGRDPRGDRRGRGAARGALPGVVGAPAGLRARAALRRRRHGPARPPPPACSTRSARPTWSCCRRATRSSPSASSSACPGCETRCAAASAPVVGCLPADLRRPCPRARRRVPPGHRARVDARPQWRGSTPTSSTAGWSPPRTRQPSRASPGWPCAAGPCS